MLFLLLNAKDEDEDEHAAVRVSVVIVEDDVEMLLVPVLPTPVLRASPSLDTIDEEAVTPFRRPFPKDAMPSFDFDLGLINNASPRIMND